MSKTIRKIPWAVPGLAMVAVAAFLAIGLLVTHGVQPVAAQDDADCTVDVGIATGIAVANTQICGTSDASAVVALPGDDGTAATNAAVAWVYAKDGTITGGSEISGVWDHDAVASSADIPAATKFSAINLDIPPATQDAGGGGAKRSEVEITVTPAVGKSEVVLYIYYQAGPPIPSADFDHDVDSVAANHVKQIDNPNAAASGDLTITFLGAPALGVDSPNDRDTAVDDDQQVTLDPVTGMPTVNPDAGDVSESRSKLVAYTGTAYGAATSLLDGSSETHTLASTAGSATVVAVVKDAAGNNLLKTPVTFAVTSDPTSILTSTRDAETAAAPTSEITAPVVAGVTGLDTDNAVASRAISGLPAKGPYKVSVQVTAGSLNLGTIVITKAGSLHEVTAATCVMDADNKAEDDGCGVGDRPSNVFKPGATFEISSQALDALGIDTTIGPTINFGDAKTMDGQDAKTAGGQNIFSGELAAVAIHADAPQGRYNLTVKATSGTGTAKIDREAIVEVIISGVVSSYGISGSDAIALAPFASEEYTISAMDSLGNPPIFAAGKMEDEVTVLIESELNPRITGLDNDGKVTLNAETGQAKITIFKPANAEEGGTVNIGIMVNGKLEGSKVVTFGTAPVPDFSAPSAVAASSDAGVVTVDWTPGDSAASQIVIAVNVADDTDYCLMALGADASSHTCDPALTAGETYVILVIALDGQGGYALGNVVTHTAN